MHVQCVDGNAENVTADGKANVMADGTMEAVYFGSGYAPKGKGSGSGPWIGKRKPLDAHLPQPSANLNSKAGEHLVGLDAVALQVLIWRTEFTKEHRIRRQSHR